MVVVFGSMTQVPFPVKGSIDTHCIREYPTIIREENITHAGN
jgi:hypothetical protein